MILRAFVTTTPEPLIFEGVMVDSVRDENNVVVFEVWNSDTIYYVRNVVYWTTDSEFADSLYCDF